MTNATGRPIATLILSPDERAYLERNGVAECRAVLPIAKNRPSKVRFTKGEWIHLRAIRRRRLRRHGFYSCPISALPMTVNLGV
jgi:hypothetical protein